MICKTCGAENKDSSTYCVKCGSVLSTTCPTCGIDIKNAGCFCPSCGAIIHMSNKSLLK